MVAGEGEGKGARGQYLLDVGACFGRGFKERDIEFVSERFGGVVIDGFLLHQIAFVAHQQFVHVLTRIPIDLVQPLLHVIERLRVCSPPRTHPPSHPNHTYARQLISFLLCVYVNAAALSCLQLVGG